MEVTETFVNRVAASGIVTINLEDYVPKGERKFIDLKVTLFQGLILREKDFRGWVKEHDWNQYKDTFVAVGCTADAIVPSWAYMLIASKLSGIARFMVYGTPADLEHILFCKALEQEDWSKFKDDKVVLKGCGTLSPAAYFDATARLMPYVSSIMYGEPCSTVPVYKRPSEKINAT